MSECKSILWVPFKNKRIHLMSSDLSSQCAYFILAPQISSQTCAFRGHLVMIHKFPHINNLHNSINRRTRFQRCRTTVLEIKKATKECRCIPIPAHQRLSHRQHPQFCNLTEGYSIGASSMHFPIHLSQMMAAGLVFWVLSSWVLHRSSFQQLCTWQQKLWVPIYCISVIAGASRLRAFVSP